MDFDRFWWSWMGLGRFGDRFLWILKGLGGFGEVWGPILVDFGGFGWVLRFFGQKTRILCTF